MSHNETFDEKKLNETLQLLQKKLDAANAEIERLSLDVKILSEELERERRPRMDER